MILVSSCRKKNFMRNNGHSLFILSLVFLKSLIGSVAFFLGHPVYLLQRDFYASALKGARGILFWGCPSVLQYTLGLDLVSTI